MKMVPTIAAFIVALSATFASACDYAEYENTIHEIDGVSYKFDVQEIGIVIIADTAHGPDREPHEATALDVFHAVTGCKATIRPGTVFEFQGAGEVPAYVWLLPE